jgi:hypothetical protein
VIYIPSDPVPVIYAVFDDHETTHYILITKTFGAQKSPAEFGSFHDSLYWDELEIEVGLKEYYTNSWIMIKPEKVTGMNKDSGFFLYPHQEYYKFDRVIMDTPALWYLPKTYSIDTISIRVSIPGYEDAFCAHRRIDSIRIVSPKYGQQFLYLTPDSPLLFNWDWDAPIGMPWMEVHAWNEIDVNFEIIEQLEKGTRSKWIIFQNTLYNDSKFEKYRQLNITYDEFIREVNLQVEDDPAVIKRKFGYIDMQIAGGDYPLKEYVELYHGHSDYNYTGYTNFENAYGILATTTHIYKDSMLFDAETRAVLYNDNKLKKLRFSYWGE